MKMRMMCAFLFVVIVFGLAACTQYDMAADDGKQQADLSRKEIGQKNESNINLSKDEAPIPENSDGPISNIRADDSLQPEKEPQSVFETENIERITFFLYYGSGEGADVPAAYMQEMTNWLASFTVGSKAPTLLPPGTNTVHVEIGYTDGTVIKQSIDTVKIDDTIYYTSHRITPNCYQEILSQLNTP